MILNIKRIDREEYLDATELGDGFLFDFERYRFIESTDIDNKPRYIIVKNSTNKKFDEVDSRIGEVEFVELRLVDFHNLCALFILSLQEGCKNDAISGLGRDLDSLFIK